jgi:hypothetical protein
MIILRLRTPAQPAQGCRRVGRRAPKSDERLDVAIHQTVVLPLQLLKRFMLIALCQRG